MKLPPIATTTVGSFPRPGWLAEVDRSQVKFRVEAARLREALDDATLLILRQQEEIGLDLLTDGEQRRPHFINHVLAAWDGIDVTRPGVKAVYRRRTQQHSVPRIVGKLKRRCAATVDDLRFAKAHTSRPIKMAVPGPLTVVDSTLDETYGDEESLAMDVAAAINAELLDLRGRRVRCAPDRRARDDSLPREGFGLRCPSARSLPRRNPHPNDRSPVLRLSGRRRPAARVNIPSF